MLFIVYMRNFDTVYPQGKSVSSEPLGLFMLILILS